MATVGAVWVDVLPSMKNFARDMRSGVTSSAKGVGTEAGKQIGDSASEAAGKSGREGGRRLGGNVASSAGAAIRAAGPRLRSAIDTVSTAAAAGGAAAFGATFSTALDTSKAQSKLTAQLGLTSKESSRVGKVAGKLFSSGYGGSMDDVSAALRGVAVNVGDLGSMSNAELKKMGQRALGLADIMGEDVSRVTRGVGQLMKNDLAPNATEAFDIITRASQRLPAEMQGELIDTIEEYSADFKQLGLTGPQAMGAISAAVQKGARNTDLAADALREFSIRALDGSKSTKAGFEAIGMDAETMASRIGKGGPSARKATSEVIRALRDIKDPVAQEAAGVALFGTRFEEMGIDAIAAMDPATAGLKDLKGATDDANKSMQDNPATQLSNAWRSLSGVLATELAPHLTKLAKWMAANPGTVEKVALAVGVLGAAFIATSGAMRAWSVISGAFKVGKAIVGSLSPVGDALKRVRDGFKSTQVAQSRFSGVAGSLGGALRKGVDATKAGASRAGSAVASGARAAGGAVVSGARAAGGAAAGAARKGGTVAAAGGKAAASAAVSGGKAAASAAAAWGRLAAAQTGAAVAAGRARVATIATAVAQRVAAVATRVWAVATRVLNLAMKMNPIGLVIIAITALVVGVVWAYNRFDWFRNLVNTVWSAISTGALWLWNVVLKPTFTAIGTFLTTVVGPAFSWLWTTVIGPAFRGIGALAMWLWTNALLPAWNMIKVGISALGMVFRWLYTAVIRPVFSWIRTAISNWWLGVKIIWAAVRTYIVGPLGSIFRWLYNSVVKPVFRGIRTAISVWWLGVRVIWAAVRAYVIGPLGSVFRWLWNSVIRPVWNGIKATISSVWSGGIKPIFNALKAGVRAMWKAFQSAKKYIATAWKGIRDSAKKPVSFLINTIYNNGIRSIWNKVAGIVGADKIGKAKGFARGGLLPGMSSYRDGDSLLVPMRPGEGVYVSEAMRDPYERARLMAVNRAAMAGRDLSGFRDTGLARGGMVPSQRAGSMTGSGFARGGWLGVDSIVPNSKDFLGAVGKFLKDIAVDVFTGDLGSAVDRVFKPAKDATAAFGKEGLPGAPHLMVGKFAKSVKEKIESFASFFMSEGFSLSGVKGEARTVLKNARAAVGRYPESGGNNTNAITRWFGMNAQPWCAMFISWLFAKSNASGSLGRAAKVSHVNQYRGAMKNVGQGNRRPGDVLVYGSRHVNLATSGRGTIGGNESNNVRMSSSYPETPTYVYRPRWKPTSKDDDGLARGGTLNASMVRKIARQDPGDHQTGIMKAARGRALGGIVPRLYDSGGYIPPGLSLVANQTGRPEPVLTDAQWRQLRESRGSGDGAASPLVGEYHQHLHSEEATFAGAADELVFKLRTARRGGVHAGRS